MSFIYNGQSSDDFGLYVEQYPPRPFPSRKADTYSIPGRSGDLIVDENAFTNTVQEYEVYISGGTVGFQKRAALIAKWLIGTGGYNELVDEYDPTIYREARFIGGENWLNALNRFGRATLTFDCKPQRYPINQGNLSGVLGDTFTFPTLEGAMPGKPLITITDLIANTSCIIETAALRIVIPAQSALKKNVYIDFETQTISARVTPLSLVSITGKWAPIGDGGQIITTLETGSAASIVVQPRRFFL